jgi:hypothetical protein
MSGKTLIFDASVISVFLHHRDGSNEFRITYQSLSANRAIS